MTRLCTIIQMYNESSRGNLRRCLENVVTFSDGLVIYDDCSTDDSVEIAKEYTKHVILGARHEGMIRETWHRQLQVEYAQQVFNPDYLFRIDCDEILCRRGCQKIGLLLDWLDLRIDVDAAKFHSFNLWRGQNWARLDGPGMSDFRPPRVWRNKPILTIKRELIQDSRLFPEEYHHLVEANFRIIHYGFHQYRRMCNKCYGFGTLVDEMPVYSEEDCARYFHSVVDPASWICNEATCYCELVHPEVFPEVNVPSTITVRPIPRSYHSVLDVVKDLSSDPMVIDGLTYLRAGPNYWDWYHGTDELILGFTRV